MKNKQAATKILALLGTGLLWFPSAATILISIIGTIAAGQFLFDYLMPAELSLFAIVGGGLLLWAAIRLRSRIWLVAGGVASMVLTLLGSQGLAVVSGLASGENPPNGVMFTVVVSMLAVHALLQIALAVLGVFILQEIKASNAKQQSML